MQLRRRKTPRIDAHRKTQVARRLFRRLASRRQIQTITRMRQRFVARIAYQIQHLRGRNTVAKKQARHFRQLVRFVEDHRVAGGQQFRHTFVAQHHVGKEQVMIDHHQIRRHGRLARLHDEAFLVIRAILAQTVIAGRRHLLPDRRVFIDFQALRLVTTVCRARKGSDAPRVSRIFPAEEAPFTQRVLQMIVADVIGPPLEQGDLRRRTQNIAHHGQILVEQLVLQGLGAGGNNHLAVGAQRRHQIGKGLARPRSGLGDEHAVALDCCGNAFGHLHLLRADTITFNGPRKRPIGRKDFLETGQGGNTGKAPECAGASYYRRGLPPWRA